MSATQVPSSSLRPRTGVGISPQRRKGLLSFAQGGPFLVLLLLVLGAPFVLLVTYSFRATTFLGAGAGPTLSQYTSIVDSASTLRTCAYSLAVGVIVAVVVTSLAFVLAYAITFRFRRRWQLVALGLVIAASVASYVVRVYAWATILGTNGVINEALIKIGLIHHPLGFLLFGYFAIVVTMVYVYMPIAVLLVYAAMQEIDPKSLDASRDLGAGRWRTALRVVAPQARVGLMTAFGLTMILACADFVTPSLVGGVRGEMVGSVILSLATTSGDYPGAAALAMFYLVLVLAAVALLWVILKMSAKPRVSATRRMDQLAARVARIAPARLARISFSRIAAGLLLIYLVFPTLVVIFFSFNSGGAVGFPWTGFSLHWYSHLFSEEGFSSAVMTSIRIGLVAVALSILIGVPAGFALARSGSKMAKTLRVGVAVPYVLPGVLIGAAMLTFAIDQGLTLGTTVTTLAHMCIVAPVIILVITARLSGMDPRLIDAARDLGSSPVRALRTVTLPLIVPALLGAALLALAYSLDELIITTFTIGSGTTLPIWLFSQARAGFNASINALGVLVMCGTVGLFALAALLMRATMIPGRRLTQIPEGA
jgi:ABC-type spermidine/putrescine transport system permease subunit II